MPTAGGLESKPRSGFLRDHERYRAATSSRAQASGSRASVCLSSRPGACDSQRTCRFVAVASSSGRRVRALVARCRPLKDGSVSYRRATQGHMCRTSRLSTALTKNGGRLKFSGFGRVGRCRNGHAEWAGRGRERQFAQRATLFHAAQNSRSEALGISSRSVRKDLELLMIRSVVRRFGGWRCGQTIRPQADVASRTSSKSSPERMHWHRAGFRAQWHRTRAAARQRRP